MRFQALTCATGLMLCAAAHADMLNFRDWAQVNGFAANSAANLWYATTGVGGTSMSSNGEYWYSPGFPSGTPLMGPLVNLGTQNGAAGPATFDGVWVHSGPGVPAVLVFAPQSPVFAGGMEVHSELVANGLSGNGVTINVLATIGGVTTDLGTVALSGINDRLDTFMLSSPVMIQPGDTLRVVVGDAGSYLFDHVNFSPRVVVPAPTGSALPAGAGLFGLRRRR